MEENSTCTVVLEYSPTAIGVHSEVLTISYNDGKENQQATNTFNGFTEAFLTISNNPSYDFGNRAITSSIDKTFTVTRTGGATATGLTGNGLAPPYSFS